MKKALFAAAAVTLGACDQKMATREPTLEEQQIIDTIVERGSYEHEAVTAFIKNSDISFFDVDGTPVNALKAAARLEELGSTIAELHDEGRIYIFTKKENAELEGYSYNDVLGDNFIALNIDEIENWDFSTFMHEAAHQKNPEWEHDLSFSELPKSNNNVSQIAELAVKKHDFPYLMSVEYGWLDNGLKQTAEWYAQVKRDVEQDVKDDTLNTENALTVFDEKTGSTDMGEWAKDGGAEDEIALHEELFDVLGGDKSSIIATLETEELSTYLKKQHDMHRKALESWLKEREEGERRVLNEAMPRKQHL